MESTSAATVLRYPMPWWYWLAAPAAAGLLGIGLVLICISCGGVGGTGGEWRLLIQGGLSLGVGGELIRVLVWRFAMQRNGRVGLEEAGLAVRDWRGRLIRVRWEQVEEMRWRLGGAYSPKSPIHVRSRDVSLRIPAHVERIASLVPAIAAKARLRCVHETPCGLGARYQAGWEGEPVSVDTDSGHVHQGH